MSELASAPSAGRPYSPTMDYEAAELVRFFGAIVGTTGVSEKVQGLCNEYLEKILETMKKDINSFAARKAGIIT